MRFDGKVAIVTGAASGIGLETARQLITRGARVLFADQNEVALTTACSNCGASIESARAQCVNVASGDSVANMVDAAMRAFGRVDILIHSAGIGLERPFLETSEAEWRRLLDVDLTGTFLPCQMVARQMARQRCGSIVTLASTAGVAGGTGRAAYGAAKGGVITLTKVMAVELAPYNIRVNALAPGAIETELVARMHSSETRTVYTSRIPMSRYGSPGETASAALFLASDLASYITGHVLSVDGGFLAAGVMHRREASVAVANV